MRVRASKGEGDGEGEGQDEDECECECECEGHGLSEAVFARCDTHALPREPFPVRSSALFLSSTWPPPFPRQLVRCAGPARPSMRRSQGAKSAGQPTERNAVPAPAKCTSSIAKSAEPPAGFTATARDNEPHDLEAARYSAPASAAAVAESSAAGGQRAGEEAEAARLELRRELAAAVANEDYDEAARIKKREAALAQ